VGLTVHSPFSERPFSERPIYERPISGGDHSPNDHSPKATILRTTNLRRIPILGSSIAGPHHFYAAPDLGWKFRVIRARVACYVSGAIKMILLLVALQRCWTGKCNLKLRSYTITIKTKPYNATKIGRKMSEKSNLWKIRQLCCPILSLTRYCIQ
jgi:hypothetical protein